MGWRHSSRGGRLLALTQGSQHLSLEGKDLDLQNPVHCPPKELWEPGNKGGPQLTIVLRSSIAALIYFHPFLSLPNLMS